MCIKEMIHKMLAQEMIEIEVHIQTDEAFKRYR